MKQDKVNTLTGKPILVIESFESKKTIFLNVNLFSIGRHPQCSLVLKDKTISRYHATIAWLKDKNNSQRSTYWVIDGVGKKQRSRNGILVNGVKTVLHRLNSGDVISLGHNITISYSYVADTTESNQIPDVIYYL